MKKYTPRELGEKWRISPKTIRQYLREHREENLAYQIDNKKYGNWMIPEENILILHKKLLKHKNFNNTDDNNFIRYCKKKRGQYKIEEGKKIWIRDKNIVERMLKYSCYECEYDSSHKYFISNKTRENYVEGHHLIPMKYQEQFEYSLDVEANIVSLCIVCHKKLHLGRIEDKIDIISKLYNHKKDLLKKSGLGISLNELIEFYK